MPSLFTTALSSTLYVDRNVCMQIGWFEEEMLIILRYHIFVLMICKTKVNNILPHDGLITGNVFNQ